MLFIVFFFSSFSPPLKSINRFVDQQFKENPKFKYPSFLLSKKHKYDYTHSLKFWNADLCAQEAHLFDFAITVSITLYPFLVLI